MEDEFAAGDRVVLRFTAYGRHAATGRPVEFGVLQIVRTGADGRFTEHWCSADLLAVAGQLNIPVPALVRRR